MRSHRALIVFVALIAAIVATWWFASGESRTGGYAARSSSPETPMLDSPEREVSRRSPVVAPKPLIVAERPALVPMPAPPGEAKSPLADELHAPDRTGAEDIAVVMNLFTQYRLRFKGYPVGEDNATFVNALSGNNPKRLAFIGRDHLAIDAQGQLLDRWGEPFFFHLIGRDELEIRSAGPDRELYTSDDLLIGSPAVQNAALASESR
jgi:hypothetical protein